MDRDNHPATGEARARRRQRHVWRAMLVPGLIAAAVLLAVKLGLGGMTVGASTQMSPEFAITVSLVLVVAVVVGAVWHHRMIDEQEERSILWANTVAFYTLIASAMVADALTMAHVMAPVSHVAVMMLALGAGVLTYLWLRFR